MTQVIKPPKPQVYKATFVKCRGGMKHRVFNQHNPDEPRHSIGTVCPVCAVDLYTHAEAVAEGSGE